jgi:hemolysin activation/secretion protein
MIFLLRQHPPQRQLNQDFPERMVRLRHCCAGASLLLAIAAHAQRPPDAGALQREIERDQPSGSLHQPAVVRAAPATAQPSSSAPTHTIVRIRFVGNTLLGEARLMPPVAGFLGRPLTFAELQEAVTAVAQTYRDAGWIVRAYLPDQDITEGVVTIQIVEATYGGMRLEGAASARSGREQVRAIVAAQLRPGEPLSANAIDRALLLADDLPGASAVARLEEGAQQGQTDLVVTLSEKALLSGDASLDNTGSRSTGAERLGLNLALNSPRGWGELLAGNLLRTAGSDYLRLSASLPLGGYGWRVGASASGLRYRIISPEFAALRAQGNAEVIEVEASYPLVRSRQSNLSLRLDLDHKTFDNRSADISTTRYRIDSLSLNLGGNRSDLFGGGGDNTASLTVVGGYVDLNGSPNQADDAATARTAGPYTRIGYSLSRLQALSDTLSVYGAFSGQEANRNLDSAEKFYLGGSTGVRAYPGSEGGGALGALLSLELRTSLPSGWSVTGFYDEGQVTLHRDTGFAGAPALTDYRLRGAGVALGWRSARGLNLRLSWARRLGTNPGAGASGLDQDGSLVRDRCWLSASMPF